MTSTSSNGTRDPIGTWLTVHMLLVYAFLYVPILVLVALSFNRAGLPTVWTGFSLEWYGKLAGNQKLLGAVGNSLFIASVATAVSTVVGTLLAMGLEERRPSLATEALIAAPMIVPDIVLAIALLSFYSLLKITLGAHSVILSHCAFMISFVCAVVRTRFKHFDRSVVEASIDLGASELVTFWRVTLPIIAPGVVAAALLGFTLSFDEFIIAYFTNGPSASSITFPMQIYAMIRFGVTPDVNAVATIVLLASFVLIFLSQRINRESIV